MNAPSLTGACRRSRLGAVPAGFLITHDRGGEPWGRRPGRRAHHTSAVPLADHSGAAALHHWLHRLTAMEEVIVP